MSHIRSLSWAFVCAVLLVGLKPAAASTYEITFGASDIVAAAGNDALPVNFVLGKFTLSLDPAHDATGSVAVNFINLFHGPVAFQYDAAFDTLTIGGTSSGVSIMSAGTDDFSLHLAQLNTAPTMTLFEYTQALATESIFQAHNGGVHVDVTPGPVMAATPIPAALPFFVSALGGLGVVGWRRRNIGA